MTADAHLADFDLRAPIPDQQFLRDIKEQYRQWPFEPDNEFSDEPLVDLADFGVRGQSFYSQPRPTDVDHEPIEGVNPQALIRQTLADKLMRANQIFQTDPEIIEIFGDQVELVIRDAYRSRELQQYLFDTVAPRRLRREHPDWTEEQIMTARTTVFAEPLPGSPPPHATGGAVDVTLVYRGTDRAINFGYKSGREYSALGLLDFHEGYQSSKEFAFDPVARDNRRALFWTMLHVGFGANPTEWWHYNYGNQMWAWYMAEAFPFAYPLEHTPAAIYGEVDGAPDWIRPDAK